MMRNTGIFCHKQEDNTTCGTNDVQPQKSWQQKRVMLTLLRLFLATANLPTIPKLGCTEWPAIRE